jgi:hypothetical protein
MDVKTLYNYGRKLRPKSVYNIDPCDTLNFEVIMTRHRKKFCKYQPNLKSDSSRTWRYAAPISTRHQLKLDTGVVTGIDSGTAYA